MKAHNLACPIDGKRLTERDRQMLCGDGHAFDIARQGYVNLLPVQDKRSKQPGDSREMVLARARFLNSGIYEPVANRLIDVFLEQVREMSLDGGDFCLMDAGCGEGYYLDRLVNTLSVYEDDVCLSCIGLDISKAAIVEAAKRNKQISWVVGTNRKPPVEASSIDFILCMFGFYSAEGFKRSLSEGGKIILVDPGPEHLQELREVIYPELKKPEPQLTTGAEAEGYTELYLQRLKFTAEQIDKQQINDLLLMTPHLFRATKQGKEAAARLESLVLTVDVVFRVLQKKR